jgi:pimeloyl-ACP methyl ester carboxylesterase
MRSRLLLLGCVMAGLASPCAAHSGQPAAAPEFRPAACAPGVPDGARCGTVSVPENPARPRGRRIALNVAVVSGEAPVRRDPLVMIAGGPGQSAVATAPAMLPLLRALDRNRDIVFVDQRGTGGSNPLTCAASFDALIGAEGRAALATCHRDLAARADLSAYGSAQAVRDLESVRAALGYAQVNLVAASYGVRVATLYMRRHPQRVRSAILRAAYGSDFNIVGHGLPAADAELSRVLDECAAAPDCRAAFPRLEERLIDVFAALERSPQTVTRPDGRTFQVTAPLFQQALYAMMLSAPTRQSLPLLIHTAATSGFQPLAPALGQVRDALYGSLPFGMYLSVLCAEDAPRLRPGSLPRGRTPLGRLGAELHDMCRIWAVPPAPADEFRTVRLAPPAFVISGLNDPATTAAAARGLMRQLRTGVHVELPGTAHGPFAPDCVREDLRQFLANPALNPQAGRACAGLVLPPFALPGAQRRSP